MPSTRAAALSERELTAWTGLLRAHRVVTQLLDHELEEGSGLSLAQYDVLVQLATAPGRQLRMTDLADAVLLSRSGLTRLVDRLVELGLVERATCPSDARGTLALITAHGLQRLRDASALHLRGVRTHVTSRLSEAELEVLGVALSRLAVPNA